MPSQSLPSQICNVGKASSARVKCRGQISDAPGCQSACFSEFSSAPDSHNFELLSGSSLVLPGLSLPSRTTSEKAENRCLRKALMLEKRKDKGRAKVLCNNTSSRSQVVPPGRSINHSALYLQPLAAMKSQMTLRFSPFTDPSSQLGSKLSCLTEVAASEECSGIYPGSRLNDGLVVPPEDRAEDSLGLTLQTGPIPVRSEPVCDSEMHSFKSPEFRESNGMMNAASDEIPLSNGSPSLRTLQENFSAAEQSLPLHQFFPLTSSCPSVRIHHSEGMSRDSLLLATSSATHFGNHTKTVKVPSGVLESNGDTAVEDARIDTKTLNVKMPAIDINGPCDGDEVGGRSHNFDVQDAPKQYILLDNVSECDIANRRKNQSPVKSQRAVPDKEAAPGTPDQCDTVDALGRRDGKGESPSSAPEKIGVKEEQLSEETRESSEIVGGLNDGRANGVQPRTRLANGYLPGKRIKESDTLDTVDRKAQKAVPTTLDALVFLADVAAFRGENIQAEADVVRSPAAFLGAGSMQTRKLLLPKLDGEVRKIANPDFLRAEDAHFSDEYVRAIDIPKVHAILNGGVPCERPDLGISQDSMPAEDEGREKDEPKEISPGIRSKRGRTHALPVRLRDSVVEKVKKGSKVLKKPAIHAESGAGRLAGPDSPGVPEMDSPTDGEVKGNSIAITSGELHPVEEFDLGDIIWAKSGKRHDPVWPAKVVDPIKEAPESVRAVCLPGRLCVMFYGPSRAKGRDRDYAWVKQGMIFPFVEYMGKFTAQTNFNKSRPSDFRLACQEALLADAGFEDCHGVSGKRHPSTISDTNVQSAELADSRDAEEDGGNDNAEVPSDSQIEVLTGSKSGKTCKGCDGKLPAKKLKTGASGDGLLCKQCVKLYKCRQYCGVCKRVWLPNDKGSWACCDSCSIWIHAECDKLSDKSLKEFKDGRSYSCPDCRMVNDPPAKKIKLSDPPAPKNQLVVPELIEVICSGTLGDYKPRIHEIICKCKVCKGEKRPMRPSEWEKHTGCRKKKWKESIKVTSLETPLIQWLHHTRKSGAFCLAYDGPEVWVPSKLRHEELAACLEVPYEPVNHTWTSERCGICRWVEDYDYNKMIVCNRCQVAVHEECYGVRASNVTLSSWVCRACETPSIERECCLCPVKGGALKPTTTPDLWVHVTCAWFMPEVIFANAAVMEPAEGVDTIPLARFREVCTLCHQIHGACASCAKCNTAYHTMCAFKAGYHMEIQTTKKRGGGAPMTRMVSYCATHKAPNPEMILIVQSREGQFAENPFRPNSTVSEGVSSAPAKNDAAADSTGSTDAPGDNTRSGDLSSAARCQGYSAAEKAWKLKKKKGKGIPHIVGGFSWNTAEQISYLRESDDLDHTKLWIDKDRVASLQKTEHTRVTFGRSGIHGYGLFARRDLREGEPLLEYRGERVRGIITDLREKYYHKEGKDCYFFRVSGEDDVVIDATMKGNIGRLINHSCDPNCFAKIWDVKDGESGKETQHIMLIARKDVAACVELTYNYRFAPEEKKVECLCGAANCIRWLN